MKRIIYKSIIVASIALSLTACVAPKKQEYMPEGVSEKLFRTDNIPYGIVARYFHRPTAAATHRQGTD